ncbi:2Fe-2S iron-sulfur cluster-binding protein [Dietzia lutea]|uniref:Oxidoreductase n=1 Tax=Dietzia lutea TaxID=546160 RepID=A0A2S1RCQ4_9ACTN|nr:2Fe-2S iron-sulfur cluster-binding protein [Dietzia lutea]AWH94045.1 oxidoreductase [Dietzia lutea]
MAPAISVAGRRVECLENQSILEALLRAGVWMPNSCNQGTCGTCKLQVLSGEIDHRDSPQETLSSQERTQGLALACQARPLRDTEVALRGADETRSTHVLHDLAGTVAKVEEIARDTRRILIDLDEALEFYAGQYIELTVPGTTERRQYSLANIADENTVLELHVRRVPGGLASDKWLFGTVAAGDRVEGLGPLGDFHVPPTEEDAGEPMVLIGGGTGLAPLVGIVRTALARHPSREVVLYHGVRGQSDLYDGGVFAELEATYAGFRFVPVLSDETSPEHRNGFPTDAFLEDIASCRGWSGWLCGPPPMVEAGVKAFKRRRMTPRLIHREKFTPADALARA